MQKITILFYRNLKIVFNKFKIKNQNIEFSDFNEILHSQKQ